MLLHVLVQHLGSNELSHERHVDWVRFRNQLGLELLKLSETELRSESFAEASFTDILADLFIE